MVEMGCRTAVCSSGSRNLKSRFVSRKNSVPAGSSSPATDKVLMVYQAPNAEESARAGELARVRSKDKRLGKTKSIIRCGKCDVPIPSNASCAPKDSAAAVSTGTSHRLFPGTGRRCNWNAGSSIADRREALWRNTKRCTDDAKPPPVNAASA